MTIDNRTPVLNLPLPHKDNVLEDDVQRIRDAFTVLDTASASKADLVDGKVPAIQLPSYVDDVVEAANFASLPTTGETGKIYVTLNDNKTYRWSGSAYVNITASPGSTDAVPEGTTNKYFTDARALAAIPVASSSVAGKVKVGAGLTVGGDGTINVTGGGGSGLPVFDEIIITPSTNGQTTLVPVGGYSAGQIDLEMNGIGLYGNGDDYTASDGVNIVLTFSTATTSDKFKLRRWSYLPESQALNKAGDTMTGSLALAGNAANAMEAVPKQQLDAAITALNLGSASTKTAGTGAGHVLLLAENNKLPALDGSQLTGLPATGITSASLPSNLAGLALGSIGTYAWLGETTTTQSAPGTTRPGSALRYSGAYTSSNHQSTAIALGSALGAVLSPTAPSGTWMCMGAVGGLGYYGATLWKRVS